ncbi:hypothetical protein F383_03186 [Gossypium arboreum]|nr:hypothetical protein F383_20135 [Gossypium arboreum]KHG19955.1 hypothetical protein F383_03186 [Gossypium arboreum]
MPKNPQN